MRNIKNIIAYRSTLFCKNTVVIFPKPRTQTMSCLNFSKIPEQVMAIIQDQSVTLISRHKERAINQLIKSSISHFNKEKIGEYIFQDDLQKNGDVIYGQGVCTSNFAHSTPKENYNYFFKPPILVSFYLFTSFSHHNSNTNLIKRRIFAWDMNQDHRDFRHRRTPTLITFDMANSGLYFINHRLVRRQSNKA